MSQKHLFFDLDRTLWDFEKNSKVALKHLFAELDLRSSIDQFVHFHKEYLKNNALLWKEYGSGKITKEHLRDERFRITLRHFKIKDEVLVKKISDGYVDISPRQTELFPNTIETLTELKKDGYKMHIITNGFKEVQHVKLNNCGLDHFFDIVVCSEEIGKNKPSKDIFHYALKNAGAQAEHSVMVGDDLEVDIMGALSSGMQAILFDPERSFKNYSDHRIHNLKELPGMLPFIWS